MQFTPKKLYYKIGEVCDLLEVEPHVLRYWETEFASLSPPKSKSGHRTYRPKDIELLLQIRKLLYEDGFTIAGARKQLRTGTPADESEPRRPTAGSARGRRQRRSKSKAAAKPLEKVREELQNILTLLERG
jgi:DNA-binding transcriptional MerR regulator